MASSTDHNSGSAATTTEHLAMAPLVDDKVAMPATSVEVIPTKTDHQELPNIASQAKIRSYHHVLPTVDVLGLAKRLGLLDPSGRNRNKVKEDNKNATTHVDIDRPGFTQDIKALAEDSEHVDRQQKNAASAPNDRSSEETAAETTISTGSADSSTEIAPEPGTAALASNEPVVRVYPPRHPNIFSKRAPQRNVGWSSKVLATISTHATEDAENDGDGLTTEELQEFQSAGQEKMARKTEGFLRMASQYSWRPRVVEDLGEVFEIED